jgi:REP-associated tyrosine transposase
MLDSARWLDQQRAIDLFAIVVMPDHVHLVLGLREFSLPEVMHRFKSYTSHVIAKATGVEGGIWQRGYHDRGIGGETALRAQVEYCLLNPVRAGLVENFRDYPYWWCCWEV